MRRDPLEIAMAFTDFLKTTKEGEEYSLNQIKDSTGLHYRTVQSYAFLIHHIQTRLPPITLQESGKASRIRVMKNPSLTGLTLEDEMILYMFDKGAIRELRGIGKPIWFPDVQTLVREGLVRESDTDRTVFLTPEGMLHGAELADKREDEIVQPMGEAVIEARRPLQRGEPLEFLSDWLRTSMSSDFPLKIVDSRTTVDIPSLSPGEYATTKKDAGQYGLVVKARAI